MSTENEGNEGTGAEGASSVPSAPPVPADAPQAHPEDTPPAATPPAAPDPHAAPATSAPQPAPGTPDPQPASPAPQAHPAYPVPDGATAQMAAVPASPQYAPPAPPQSAADAGWPPPPPPAAPAYAQTAYGSGGGPVWGAPGGPQTHESPRKRGGGGLVAAVVVAALVAGGIGGALGFWAADRNNDSGSTTVAASSNPQDLKRDPGTVAGVAAKALPSVVTIEAQGGNGEGGTGTGFVYDKEGHILTNNHVVASAAESGQLTATFSNGKKYDAEVVGRAQGYDVAVIKLKNPPKSLAPLPLGNSDQVAVGDSTIAIGAPFGLSNTVTTGIISAKNRPVASGDGNGGSNSYMSALQTDASINPGNSGGPLLSAGGAVIGINSAIQSTGSIGQSQAGSIGLGFAIPINQAKTVAQQLIKTGQPVYPVIGATVTMDEKNGGAVIADRGAGGTDAVTKNGPAAKAGLRAGDVITKFNDTVIDSGPTLIGEIWTHKPGDRVTLTYERDGKTATAEVTLGERKGDS
ncbi:S1C family serine protease [Streptomyces sp. NBC_00525]|uniref:S1C family serine protease n=1 Tax=Streptomyces sp. NBC_00525 TaxID=2903660 RepID=UPI002E80486A|nr:trypsin-like peptidase domain-containing protein [Streptomyces sp. NBC_00525]WUC94513.1 trypsin-like peptidase domain-containing protein [Streptomyces sp. NBC_00525]